MDKKGTYLPPFHLFTPPRSVDKTRGAMRLKVLYRGVELLSCKFRRDSCRYQLLIKLSSL